MKTTREQLLRNSEIQPSKDVIAKALGEANIAYEQFVNELAKHDIQLEWRYYNDGKAWLGKGRYKWTGLRGGQNEKTVFWLSIWEGFFKVTIFIPQKDRLEVSSLSLDGEMMGMIPHSKQVGERKNLPLVFDVYSEEMFETIFSLVDFKKSRK
jgi:hypothetical protein